MISKEAIEKIESMSVPNFKENFEGDIFCDKKMYQIKPEPPPAPECLIIHTLSGLMDYIISKLDDEKSYVVHVGSPYLVDVYGEYEPEFGRRKKYVLSCAPEFKFQFGNYYDQEMFIIQLQAQFVNDENLQKVLKVVGNVQNETIIGSKDNGMTQTATVKQGIVKVENVELPNPINLKPKRTFPEVAQVESSYVLRMSKNNVISFALFEADGGQWEVSAIHRIKDHLESVLADQENITIIA